MRAAPPVSVRGTGGRPWQVAQTLLFAAAAATSAGWLALRLAASPPLALALSLGALLLAAILAWRLCAPTRFELRWDGQRWSVDGVGGSLAVMIDLGPWLLLRLRADQGPTRQTRSMRRTHWLPLVASSAGPHRHALRAALYAGATPVDSLTAPRAAR